MDKGEQVSGERERDQVRLVEIAVNSAKPLPFVSLCHCKDLEVDLTLENIISVAVWVHLGLGSGPPPSAMV